MTGIDIEARFRSLQKEAERIKSLVAQEQMKQRRTLSTRSVVLESDKSMDGELRVRRTLFQMRTQEIRYILDHKVVPSITKRKSEVLKQRLQKIEAEIQ